VFKSEFESSSLYLSERCIKIRHLISHQKLKGSINIQRALQNIKALIKSLKLNDVINAVQELEANRAQRNLKQGTKCNTYLV